MDQAKLIEGGLAVDDRGIVRFVNDFDFQGVKRFYTVTNHAIGCVRAWHGHKHEAKYLTVLKGAALVCAVEIDDLQNRCEDPSLHQSLLKFVLSAAKPAVLYIPPGYAHGWKSLTPETLLGVFSTATLGGSQTDDIRFPIRCWGVWDVRER